MALISTGDELVLPGAPTEGVMLPASNGVMLQALMDRMADVQDAGLIPDRLDALVAPTSAPAWKIDLVNGGGGSGGCISGVVLRTASGIAAACAHASTT